MCVLCKHQISYAHYRSISGLNRYDHLPPNIDNLSDYQLAFDSSVIWLL